jgi:alkylhydroperoxidase family enzyme
MNAHPIFHSRKSLAVHAPPASILVFQGGWILRLKPFARSFANIDRVLSDLWPSMDRLDPFETGAEAMKALVMFGSSAHARGLEPELVTLAKTRALQLSGGKYGEAQCRRMALVQPELAPKIAVMADGYTSRLFSPRERAALLWTESVAFATVDDITDAVYAEAARYFPADELWALTVAIVSMTIWARIARTFRMTQGVA